MHIKAISFAYAGIMRRIEHEKNKPKPPVFSQRIGKEKSKRGRIYIFLGKIN